MTAVNNSVDGSNAFPDIVGNVTVIGNAATITRLTSAPNFRFFIVDEGGSLSLSNLTLSNGSISSSNLHGGGAILNRSQLTVNGVSFLNNRALASTGGGAIDNHDMGQMTVTLSTFIGNVALQGGAIEDEATLCHTSQPDCGQGTVMQSTFTNNSSTQYGGGAFESQLSQPGVVFCQPTWPQPQSCQAAGGAYDTLIGNTFIGNSAMTEGGAIANFGTTTVSNSTLYNNWITGTGPSGDGGGGGIQNTGSITITQSTLSANRSLYGANVHNYNDTPKQLGPPATTLRMSIVANGVSGQNCGGSVAIMDAGYNLDSTTSCGFSSSNHSLSSADPQLGTLQSNGGPTQTMAVPLLSPAVDAIPANVSGCAGSADQRGVTRPQGAGCDVGAFEVVQSGGDTQPPTTPTGLAATSVSASSVRLAWSASTDNFGVAGYTVYRNATAIGTNGGTTTSYTDLTVAASTTYTYTVDAFDAAGNHSAKSASVSVTTPAPADTSPPTVPTGLAATSVSASSVGLAWNASTDNVGVAGYTVYRNGTAIGTNGGATTSYTDLTVAPSTTYTYTVDAFDAAGNHSAQSATVSANVPGTGGPKFIQGGVTTTGSRVTSVTLTLGAVAQGDLLVGWFGQYDSGGQVSVSDNVHGVWTRSASTTWRGSSTAPGDIALYYLANAGAAPSGITITITSTGATYLQATASEYSGVAAVNALDQVVVAKGSGTTAASGLTAAVRPSELVYGAMTATGGPGALTAGTSQGVAFVKRAQSSNGTQGEEDIVAGAAGQQQAVFTFATSVPWFIVCAVFRRA